MFQWFIECMYNCCFGIRQEKKKYNKLHDALYAIENLSQEEFNKLMRIYNIKCCSYYVNQK